MGRQRRLRSDSDKSEHDSFEPELLQRGNQLHACSGVVSHGDSPRLSKVAGAGCEALSNEAAASALWPSSSSSSCALVMLCTAVSPRLPVKFDESDFDTQTLAKKVRWLLKNSGAFQALAKGIRRLLKNSDAC